MREQLLATADEMRIVNPYRFVGGGGSDSPGTGDLVSWWALEEDATADRVDSHTNGNDLTASGSIARATGKVGSYGCDFESGDSRYLYIANANITGWSQGGANPLTINFWFKAEGRGGALIGKGNEIVLRAGANTNLEFILNSLSTNDRVSSSNNSWALNTWQMWTLVYRSGGDLEIWIDGALDNSVTPTGTWAATSDPLYLGQWAANYADGVMDEVSLWNAALSQAEIEWLYNSGSGRAYADL